MDKYMQVAIEEAREGIRKSHGGPFGCVIVKNGEIIGRGHNEVVKQNDPTCHGEIMAIHDACKNVKNFDLSDCELYTTGEPCPMCLGAIMWANIKKVYYGCNVDDTEIIGFRDKRFYDGMDKIKERMFTELSRDECLELYKEYNEITDKTNY